MRSPPIGLLLALAVATLALRADASPMLHERIGDDPQDDLAMKVTLDGNLPAAIETPSGLVAAPDPRRPVDAAARGADAMAAKGTSPIDSRTSGVFVPDRDTRRPGLLPYDEPFTPSTAPFKRVAAFDAVDASFRLYVSHPERQPLDTHGTLRAGEEPFFADIVVYPAAGQPFRIPSVGPGARVLRARLGAGARDIDFELSHDGADNWFVEANEPGRLVMEVSIPRAALGGELVEPGSREAEGSPGNVSPPKLPLALMAEARRVAAAVGVDAAHPRDAVRRLVEYFRSFADSEERPTGKGSIYLDLALSKKGVCRHRAYAFMITALGLGIPARMVTNEAHAWVEVKDAVLWTRIDLGGAGGMLDARRESTAIPYAAPPDPYPWPPGAESGEALGRREMATLSSSSGASDKAPSARGSASPSSASAETARGAASVPAATASPVTPSDDHASHIVLESLDSDVRRGAPLQVRGLIESEGEPCSRVRVEVFLRDVKAGTMVPVGALATDLAGKFAGALVVPLSATWGDYDVVARTEGGAACGQGASE